MYPLAVRTEEEMAEVMGGLRRTRHRGIGGSGCHGNVKKIRPGGTFKKNPLTPVLVPGLIFGPVSQRDISKSDFKNEISSSVLLDIQLTLLCVREVDSFIPDENI